MRTEAGNFVSPSPIMLAANVRWYVLANRGGAVIYKDTGSEKFKFVQRLTDPRGRLKEGDLDSDRPGRGDSSADGTIHHGLDRTFNHHEGEAKEFAKKIALTITEAARSGRVDDLVIASEPHFLGLLRAALPESIKSLVKFEINREYNYGSDDDIHGQILTAIEKLR